MKRAAAAYLFEEGIFVHPRDFTVAGMWIFSEPVVRVALTAPNRDKGVALMTAIEQSRREVPHPPSWTGLTRPLERALNVRSWAELARRAKLCEVTLDGAALTFMPYRRERRGNYVSIDDGTRTLEWPCHIELVGETIVDALNVAQ